MIDWFTTTQIVVACAAGALCIVAGLIGKSPNDLTMGSILLVELLLVCQGVVSISLALAGHGTSGSAVEFAGYLLTALIVPVAAGLWALVERTRWSTVILGAIALTVALMVYRMDQVWFAALAG